MNDTDLIQQIRAGNTHAFRHLIDKYGNMVWSLVLRMVRQYEDAEDLSQEVFLRVYREIHRFRGESKLSTWIGSVAFNVSTDYLRKKGRSKVSFHDAEGKFDLPDYQHDPSETLNRDEIKKLIHRIIGDLPFPYRTVITLYHLEEFSYAEIAEITRMPEGTVKSYISRGRSVIREQLKSRIPGIEQDYSKTVK